MTDFCKVDRAGDCVTPDCLLHKKPKKPRPAMRTPWSLGEALVLLRSLEPRLHEAGFTCGIAGSVLHKGASEDDLDVIIFPRTTEYVNHTARRGLLVEMGWTLAFEVHDVMRAWRRQSLSNDCKHVEVWNTPGGKRVDLFLLQ